MRSSWSEPYLWVHLAGIAAVPIFLELCLVGLAASRAVLPAGIGFLLVALVGISPILWMQWYRPFCIFSLVALALKPSELTETQRRILQRFKTPVAKAVAVTVAILAFLILWQLNQWLPYAPMLKLPGGWVGGLVLAAVAFLLSNLFLQVPASVLTVLLTPESQIAAANPYPVAQIPADFTLIGLQVKQILPPIALLAPAPVDSVLAAPAAPPVTPIAEATSSKRPESEIIQPEIQPEAIQPEIIQPETSQPTISEPELPQPEILQPGSTEPPAVEAKAPSLAENAPHFEPVQAESELSTAVVDVRSDGQESPVEADAATDRQIPQVTDTVVMIVPSSVEAVSQLLDSTPNGSEASEMTEAEPSAPDLPTVTDTIVTIGLPLTAAIQLES